jgi:hypothetical protein
MVTVTTAQRVPRLVGFAVAKIWLVLAVTVGALVAADVELGRIGRADLRSLHGATWVILAAIGSSSVVGSVLALRRPRHPVGWLFIGLAVTMLLAGAIDTYAVYGALARPGSLPGARQLAVIGDSTFISWLVLVAVILHVTPTVL